MQFTRIIEKLDPTYDFYKLKNEADIVIDDIVKTLSIRKGSYVFDPEVGSELYKYIFGLSDRETYRAVYSEVEAIIRANNKASLDDLKIAITSDRKGIIIDIYITILATAEKRKITILATNEYVSLLEVENV